ncbi:conserved Plasmodium protein, unknown function [Plasmodium sp. gorilla clade G3]|nr:conserved Plasmodium protein, unknown function [Plasmodium sp. gorilla clade G3]
MLDENLSCLFDESDDEWKKKKKKKKEEENIQQDHKKRNEKNVQQKNSSSSILNFNISNIKNLDNFFKSINNENINKSKSNDKLRSVDFDHVGNVNKEKIDNDDDNNKCNYNNMISNVLNKKGGDKMHVTNNDPTKKQAILKNKEINNKDDEGDKKFLDEEYNKDENCSSYEEKKKQRYKTNMIRSISYKDRNKKHKDINNNNNDDVNYNDNNNEDNYNNNNNEDNNNNNIYYCDSLIKEKNIEKKKNDMYIYSKDKHMYSSNCNSLNKEPLGLKKKKNMNATNLYNKHITTNNINNNITNEEIGEPIISEQYEIHESNRTKHMAKLTEDMKSFSTISNIYDKSIIRNVCVNEADKTSNLNMFIESYNISEMTKKTKDNNNNINGNNSDCNNVYSNNICSNNICSNNICSNNMYDNNNNNYYYYNKEKELIFCFSFIKYHSWIKALQILNIPVDFFHLGINSHKYIHKNNSEESFLYKYNIHNILKNKHFSNYKIERMIVLVKNIICRNHGYFLIVMDPSGQMPASVHKEVEIEYKKHIDIGSTLLLKNVTVFDTMDNFPYLIITLRSLVRVIKPEQTDASTKEKIFNQIYL